MTAHLAPAAPTPPRTGGAPRVSRKVFLIGFAVVAMVVAGLVSYAASSSPDGLDSTTLQGCTVTNTAAGEQLHGTCIAQHATDHAMASSPLADYSVLGISGSNGIAGIIGVLVTLAAAVGLFWVIARRRTHVSHVSHVGDGH